MKNVLLLLIFLTVVYSEEPIEVVTRVTYHNLTGLVAGEGSRYTVVSHNEMVESREGRLSVKGLNGTLLSEADLGYQPDELHAYNLNNSTHVVAASHAERSSVDKVSYCRYYATRDQRLICRAGQSFIPPTKFVVSILVDENNVKMSVIYFQDYFGQFEYSVRDLIAETDEPMELPVNCTCSNFSNCLKQNDEPKGRVILRCDSGVSYLYELNSQFSYYVSTANAKQLLTTSYKDIILAVQWDEGQFQDMLVERNMVMHPENASAQPLPGVLANSSNPTIIQGIAIVSVNQLEVCLFIQNNKILYFKVVDLGLVPKIRRLSLSADLTPTAIRGIFGSSIAVEAIHSNGSLILIIIEVRASQPRADPTDGNTKPNRPPPLTNNTTSCTSQGHDNITEQPESEEPGSNDASGNHPQSTDATNNSATRDWSNSFVITISIVMFIAGVIFASCFVLVIALRRLNKSRGYNIEMTERNNNNE